MATKKSQYPRARIMWFCTNVYAPNGKEIITFEQCDDICKMKSKSIEKYTIGLHDHDVHDEKSVSERESHRKQIYMEQYKKYADAKGIAKDSNSESGYVYDSYCRMAAEADRDFYYPAKVVGDAKELHIHCLLKLKYARSIDEIARWFNIPVTMIDIIKGRHAFEEGALYMVHKKQPEKFNYESMIATNIKANYNYQEWLDNQVVKDELHEKYRISVEDINDIVNEVATNGLSLHEVEKMVSAPIYLRNVQLFKKARQHYIYEKMPMPPVRFVFYVDSNGQAGAGKSVATKALCKQFAREYGADITLSMNELKRYIYKAGNKGVAWEKYDGQPIVYIDDREAVDMLREFNGHAGVKNLFERFPEKDTVNIKYGDATIVAKYIIINGIQPYVDFVNGLNGTYVDKNGDEVTCDNDVTQYARRITGIIRISEEEVSMLFNKGVMEDTAEYNQYVELSTMKYNFRRSVEKLSGEALVRVETRTFNDMVNETKRISDKMTSKIEKPEDIPQEFWSYGEKVNDGKNRDIKI